jgi:hypothetical protein
MAPIHRAVISCLLLASACSSSGAVQGGGESSNPVWLADSTGFEVTVAGGFGVEFPDGSVCSSPTATWRYVAASRALTVSGCANGQLLEAAVILTAASASDLVARLSSLRSKGPLSNVCPQDAADETLTILDPAGNKRTFASDTYSDSHCSYSVPGPYVAETDLSALEDVLSGYATASQPPDAGGGPDAGLD